MLRHHGGCSAGTEHGGGDGGGTRVMGWYGPWWVPVYTLRVLPQWCYSGVTVGTVVLAVRGVAVMKPGDSDENDENLEKSRKMTKIHEIS